MRSTLSNLSFTCIGLSLLGPGWCQTPRDDVTCPSGVSSLSMLSVDAACAYLFSLTLLVLDKRTGKNGLEFLIGWCDYPNLIDDVWESIAGQRT